MWSGHLARISGSYYPGGLRLACLRNLHQHHHFSYYISLNALIIIAVKIKHQVKTKSNLAIACLFSTDGIMGVIGQHLFTSWVTAELQGNTSSTYFIRTLFRFEGIRYCITISLGHDERREVHCYQTSPAVRNHRHRESPHLFVRSPVDLRHSINSAFIFRW